MEDEMPIGFVDCRSCGIRIPVFTLEEKKEVKYCTSCLMDEHNIIPRKLGRVSGR